MSAPSADTVEHVRKATRTYLLVGLILFIFTGVTVAVATVPWLDVGAHGFDAADATVGLIIAAFKASMVAAVFMHLNHEKKMVHALLGIGVFFGIAMFVLLWLAYSDPVAFQGFYGGSAGAN
jgi:caa(3)-type oxidase subunit IV